MVLFLKILYEISLWSNALPLIGGLYFLRKNDYGATQKLFLYYAILIVVTQIFNTGLAYAGYHNIWFFEVSLLIDVAFFYYFYNLWQPVRLWFKIFTLLVFVFLAVMIPLRYLVLHTEEQVSYTFPVVIIYFVVQSSLMIIKTFEKNETEFNKSYVFWISFARLFYFMAILPFTIFTYIFKHLDKEIMEVYSSSDSIVNYTANIVLNVLFMYSFRCRS